MTTARKRFVARKRHTDYEVIEQVEAFVDGGTDPVPCERHIAFVADRDEARSVLAALEKAWRCGARESIVGFGEAMRQAPLESINGQAFAAALQQGIKEALDELGE